MLIGMEVIIALAAVAFFVWIGVIGDRRSSKHLFDFFEGKDKSGKE